MSFLLPVENNIQGVMLWYQLLVSCTLDSFCAVMAQGKYPMQGDLLGGRREGSSALRCVVYLSRVL